MTVEIEQRLLTEAQAARYLGLSRAFLSRARAENSDGPAFVRCGGAVRYDWRDVDRWIDTNRCSMDDAAGLRADVPREKATE